MLYTEAEYRYGISKNGLIEGEVFANAQAVPIDLFYTTKVMPAAGFGIRLKLNKLSKTNPSVDYGMGADGSKGFFFSLGEVF